MPRLRPFRVGDEPWLSEICLRTADAGADATGLLEDDGLWAAVFVLPYVAHDPGLAFVVEGDDGRPLGYAVAAEDTAAFEEWFRTVWWPRLADRWPTGAEEVPARDRSRQEQLLAYAAGRGRHPVAFAESYPAHLHIDLLPALQGQGWGRRLIDALLRALAERGVRAVHLVADDRNESAAGFYGRLGFERIPAPPGSAAFAREV